jgi:tetratricopeptide (TPR) repeat protein
MPSDPNHPEREARGGLGLPPGAGTLWPHAGSAASSDLGRLVREAEAAWSEQDYARSIGLLEEASRREPGNPSLLLQLAKAHGLRFDYAAAERCIAAAVRVSPRPARTLAEAGRECLEFGRTELAIRYLLRASRGKDAPIGALVTLADLYVRERRLGDARRLAERAARLAPADPRVRLTRTQVARRLGSGGEAEAELRALAGEAASGTPVRVRACYELAALCDEAGRCDEAIAAAAAAKALQRADATPYTAALRLIQQRCAEMEGSITAEVLERWREGEGELAPTRRIALLCGHPRSGTTLLELVVDAHPEVVSAEETRLLHDEAYLPLIRELREGTPMREALDAASPDLLQHAREHYFRCAERLLGAPIGGRLLLDKNPALNPLIPAVVRVFPEARFLVALRDPRDVVLSCFLQPLALTPISSSFLSLEETVRHYAIGMGFWLALRPHLGGRGLEVRYEELVDDLAGVARRVLDFLGVAFDERVLRYDEHARSRRVKSPSYADVVKPLYRTAVGRWRRYEKHLAPHLGALEPVARALGYP